MKVSLSWMREFAPLEGSAEEIAEQLTQLGMELESVTTVGGGLEGVVVARVLEVREHPDADRIRLVDVDAGDGHPLQICCGASNMAPGDLVPLATVGAVLPGGMEIAVRRMRGQVSNGMLCSARELELGEDHAGILVLDHEASPGTPIVDALELTPDVVFEIDALPNRPDTLSVLGVARDLAAHQGVPFSPPEPDPPTAGAPTSELCGVRLDAPDLCGRFVARVLSGVRVAPSPRWLQHRLLAAGMRPINNVVDVSNYVMLETGQPNHTYDLAELAGRVLGVRWARAGEQLVTLDGVTRDLDPRDGVIVDGDDRPVGLAGVMGGASTEISEATTEVLLEAAWWDPGAVADTSARHQLHSEASLRFKRGVDTELAPYAARRAAELLARVAGAELHPDGLEARGELPEPARIRLRPDRVDALLGIPIGASRTAELLGAIGFTVEPDGDELLVTVPTWRPDCSIEVDLVEEVARHHGYANLARTLPVPPGGGELSPSQRDRRTLRRVALGAGFDEAMPMPFLAPGDLARCGLDPTGLELANPLAAEESVLRTSLRPGLLAAVRHNQNHRQVGVRLYEVGRVFGVGEGVVTDPDRSERLGRVLRGEAEHLGAVLGDGDVAEAVALVESLVDAVHRGPVGLRAAEVAGLHPARAAEVVAGDRAVGAVGEVDPVVLERLGIEGRVAWAELDLSALLELPATVPQAAPVSRFPSSDVDLALVVAEEVVAADVAATIRAAAGPLLADLELFDVFRGPQLGEGRRSLAYRLRLQADDHTLTDAEVGGVRDAVVAAVGDAHGATLRS
jgi:phenylalanyl-tRNA synthetase beta chain